LAATAWSNKRRQANRQGNTAVLMLLRASTGFGAGRWCALPGEQGWPPRTADAWSASAGEGLLEAGLGCASACACGRGAGGRAVAAGGLPEQASKLLRRDAAARRLAMVADGWLISVGGPGTGSRFRGGYGITYGIYREKPMLATEYDHACFRLTLFCRAVKRARKFKIKNNCD
jgi:hypothetical protein